MKRVLCVGMAVCDVLLKPISWDVLQRDSVSIDTPVTSCGGDALNVAMALSKLGLPVRICGRIGLDGNGAFIRRSCQKAGVDDSGLRPDPSYATASSYVLIDPEGERHFLSDRRLFHVLSDEDVSWEDLLWADVVYFGSAMALQKMNEGGLERLFRRARELGRVTAMDAALTDAPAPENWLEYLKPALRFTDVFFPSLEEAQAITGLREPEDMAEAFRGLGLKVLGIKLGSRGCFVTDFTESRRIPAVPGIRVVDTCGAGDSFMAGFLCGMTQGWDPFQSAAFASCVAAKNVQAVGGTAGVPTFDDALGYYHKFYSAN